MAFDFFTVEQLRRGLVTTPPARLAVFGDPVAHSRSPQMHNPALAARGIAAQYVRLHVRPEEFREALALCRAAGFFGVNCTIPHKFAALEAVDEPDALARRLGAVNTVVFRGEKTLGFNSDGPGLLRAVREAFAADVRDLRVLVLGAGGGAGRAAAIQCAMEACPRLALVNRTRSKLDALVAEVAAFFPADRLVLLEQPDLREVDLVINATSVGMRPDDLPLLPAGALEARHLVYDMVYSPPQTALLDAAAAAGARGANGLSMLLHQGAVSFEHWFGGEAPLEAMRAGLAQSLA